MYEIIYMRADYEPWWLFEGWQDEVVQRWTYDCPEEASVQLARILEGFRKEHRNEASRDQRFWAFWSEKESCFCEDCAEDLQLYHGILTLRDGQPSPFSRK
ncbi:DUF1033 family protein [Bhargavaea ullalensis]|uniref:DUF1033 domain-containing protein n=1 Tax=Bhargavaea ullalensis TaxID=1265685 RepID=A0ABV2G9D4_9BACL